MPVVNMLDAKTNLSKLVDAVESGAEDEVIIARNGKPAAKLVAVTTQILAAQTSWLSRGQISSHDP